MNPTTDSAAVGKAVPKDWRCPDCMCGSFARVAERKLDGSFGPGALIRCVECKSVFRVEPAALSAHPSVAAGDDGERAALVEVCLIQARELLRLDPTGQTPPDLDAAMARLCAAQRPASAQAPETAVGDLEEWAAAVRDAETILHLAASSSGYSPGTDKLYAIIRGLILAGQAINRKEVMPNDQTTQSARQSDDGGSRHHVTRPREAVRVSGGDLDDLWRLQSAMRSAENLYRLGSASYVGMASAETAFNTAAIAYVRNLLATPSAAPGGSDREWANLHQAYVDVLLKWADFSSRPDLNQHQAEGCTKELLALTPQPALPGAVERVETDPDRLLKDALSACVAAGGGEREYGGVLTAGGKTAWVRFSTEPTPPTGPDAAGAAGEGTQAARDVLAERRRQVEAEGWTPEHDDEHSRSEMGWAAAAYALHACGMRREPEPPAPFEWPWGADCWKPTDPRRDLVKAGALIQAEIERLDRAALAALPAASGAGEDANAGVGS